MHVDYRGPIYLTTQRKVGHGVFLGMLSRCLVETRKRPKQLRPSPADALEKYACSRNINGRDGARTYKGAALLGATRTLLLAVAANENAASENPNLLPSPPSFASCTASCRLQSRRRDSDASGV